MNFDFAKLCGKHSAIYEAYYKQIDPKGSGAIEAMTAAKFLKKSGLSDVVLSRIWDLSDPNGKGFLDKPGFFVALKLVSLAQAGQVINMSNIYTDTTNPPKVGELPKIIPQRIQPAAAPSAGVASGDWSIKIIDRLKYEQLFESLKPVGGMLAGNKVKGVLMESKLPMDTLGKIWDLADQDKDGNLDKHEFIVAMHLVYQTLEKRVVPDVLPIELRKAVGVPPPKPAPPVIANAPAAHGVSMPRAPSGEGFGDGGFVADFPKDIAPPPAIPPLPAAVPHMQRVPIAPSQTLISTDPLIPIAAPTSVAMAADWVVTPAELKRYETIFRDSDRDKDGLVSGLEIKNVFLQSGVPQNCLAHIWALCDTNQSGKLTLEQFALAMWMVERKQQGLEPPQVLTSNMVPPSMRGIVAGVDLQSQEPRPTYSNPELEMISKEIEELAKERRALETEIAQKEADIRIKSGEVRSLQSELDTLSATLKQLEHQRGEAQKRLDDLKTQSTEYQEALSNITVDIFQKRSQVTKIREQCQKQEETINEQEGELNSKRSELQKLKDEEAALQKEYDANNKELQNLTKHLQNTQLQISSVRSMVTQLLETQRQMTDALLMCRAAIESNNADLVTEYQLKIEPDFYEARNIVEKKTEITESDPFDDGDSHAIKAANGFATNGFDNDPFAAANTTNSGSRIATGFDDSFNSGFDAFSGSGMGNSSFAGQQNKDPFGSDAFAANKSNAITPEPGKDDFGSDPFAALHAPTGQGQVLSPNAQKSGPPPRPESPSPALPPKKSKVPPPRPAPPRPLQGPTRPTPPSDAFGSTANSSGGFADFADFDNKQIPIIPPTSQPPTTTTTTTMKYHSLTPSLALNSRSKSSLLFHTSPSPTAFTSSSPSEAAATTFNSASEHLKRANNASTTEQTELLQAICNRQKTFTAAAMKSEPPTTTPPPPPPPPAVICGPTDFSDDPFKDYRYEDPFNIKDPFADDDDTSNSDENIFRDDLSSNDDGNNNNANANEAAYNTLKQRTKSNAQMMSSDSATSQTFDSANSNANLIPHHKSNEFLQQFDAFNLTHSSPVPSPVPSPSAGETTVTTKSTSVSAFANALDNFADFDAFSTKSSNDSSIENFANNNNNHTTAVASLSSVDLNKDKVENDTFFDAFDDNFLNNTKLYKNTESQRHQNILNAFGSIDTKITNNQVTADAFASVSSFFDGSREKNFDGFIKKSTRIQFENDFNDAAAFEDDFFKGNNTSSSPLSADVNLNFNKSDVEKTEPTKSGICEDFAKFDDDDDDDDDNNLSTALNNCVNVEGAASVSAFDDKLIKVQNNTMPHKVDNSASDAKVPSKYAADYSNADSFCSDLEEAIKRSLLDK